MERDGEASKQGETASKGQENRHTVDEKEAEEEDEDWTLLDEPGEFYDPEVDEQNEKWANKQRKGRKSDAVLSCPACFTTVCIDCQRHEKYVTQYRAMFVRNCRIGHNEVYQDVASKQQRKLTKRKRSSSTNEGLKPVRCEVCGYQVGVYDDGDGIYHFYNAIPSYS